MRIREDFAAAGGCSTGKVLAGLDPDQIIGVDFDADAVATARAAGHRRIHADVRDVRDHQWGDLDGYTAGPPCQTFSTAGGGSGRRALAHLTTAAYEVASGTLPERAVAHVADETLDERSVMVLEPLLVIARHRPGWVMLEQVPAVLPIWERYAEILEERWGYNVSTGVLRAEQFDVAQTRRRAILVASLEGKARLPQPTHSAYCPTFPSRVDLDLAHWKSSGDALGEHGFEIVSNYGTGGDPKARGRRASWQPAAAITGRAGRNRIHRAGGGWDHMTTTEAAILQSFPADYPWKGRKGSQYQQIGNATPPRLSAAIIRELISS